MAPQLSNRFQLTGPDHQELGGEAGMVHLHPKRGLETCNFPFSSVEAWDA